MMVEEKAMRLDGPGTVVPRLRLVYGHLVGEGVLSQDWCLEFRCRGWMR